MKRQHKILIAIIAGSLILTTAVATAAFAAPSVRTGGVSAPTQADYEAWGCPMLTGDYSVVAELLGLTTQDIEAQLEQGKSLVEIAAAKSVSEDELVAAILEPMKQFMQEQVTGGNWTQAQLDARLKLAEEHIRQAVNDKDAAGYYGGCGGMMRGSGGDTPANQSTTTTGYRGMMGGGMMGGGMMGGLGRTY